MGLYEEVSEGSLLGLGIGSVTACCHTEGNIPDSQLAVKIFRRRQARESGRHQENSLGMLFTLMALPADSDCKIEESSWGVIAMTIVWLVCEEGMVGVGTRLEVPNVVWMWKARH